MKHAGANNTHTHTSPRKQQASTPPQSQEVRSFLLCSSAAILNFYSYPDSRKRQEAEARPVLRPFALWDTAAGLHLWRTKSSCLSVVMQRRKNGRPFQSNG